MCRIENAPIFHDVIDVASGPNLELGSLILAKSWGSLTWSGGEWFSGRFDKTSPDLRSLFLDSIDGFIELQSGVDSGQNGVKIAPPGQAWSVELRMAFVNHVYLKLQEAILAVSSRSVTLLEKDQKTVRLTRKMAFLTRATHLTASLNGTF